MKLRIILFCIGCVLCLAIAGPIRSHGASAGFVMFAPQSNVESAFGQKLQPSNARYAVIHASGKDFDYFHYTYDVVGTNGTLMIAYYTFSSDDGAKRELQRLSQDHHFVTDNVLKNAARFFRGSQGAGATFAVNCKSDLIVVNANKLKTDDITRQRLKRVAQLVLDPNLRGHIPE